MSPLSSRRCGPEVWPDHREEAKAAERYDALMEHSEAIANAPKKQTEAPVVCFEGDFLWGI